jgi:hypothetical protein
MKHIEEFTGKRVFYVDFVPDKTGNISGIFAGYSPEINDPTWKFTESLYTIEVPQADILVVGIPKYLLYGKANNPLTSLAGICAAPRFGVNKPLLREGGVIIGMTCCNGEIDDRAHCSYREVIGLFRRCRSSYELQQYEEEFLNREDLVFKYRFAGVPTAGNKFSTLEREGEGGPGATRDVGCTPATSFEDAMKLAEKVVGKSPTIVAFPEFWSQTRPYVYVR